MNLILCGFMGCGKTTVGKLLAKQSGYAFADTDEVIELEQGMPVSRIFDTLGESGFRDLEHEICRRLGSADKLVISTGGGALAFKRNVEALNRNGKIVFLDVPFPVLQQRVGNGETRPLFRDAQEAERLFEQRVPLYRSAADAVIDGNCPPEKAMACILKIMQVGKGEAENGTDRSMDE